MKHIINTSILSLLFLTVLSFNIQLGKCSTTTTFNISVSGDDGYVYGMNDVYNTARTVPTGSDNNGVDLLLGQQRYYFTPRYRVRRTFLKFDTSEIGSDAIITSAKLRLYGRTDVSTTDFIIRLQKWTGNVPINTGDYNSFDGINYDDGTFSTSGFQISAYNNITLSDFGLINKIGNTLICVRSSRDISAITPTGSEYVGVEAVDGTNMPKLEITWTTAPLGEWHSVEVWFGDLITREWSSVESWFGDLITRGWINIENWFGQISSLNSIVIWLIFAVTVACLSPLFIIAFKKTKG